MEILIFSDSHGNTDGMRHALDRQVGRIDAIFFLGDGLRDVDALDTGDATVYRVAGNCDWFSAGAMGALPPTECVTALQGHTILLTHGHRFGVKGGYGALLAHAVGIGADIVLSGHTHMPHAEILPVGTQIGQTVLTRPLYLFNPGSIAYNTDGHGRSFGVLLLRGETVLLSHGRI